MGAAVDAGRDADGGVRAGALGGSVADAVWPARGECWTADGAGVRSIRGAAAAANEPGGAVPVETQPTRTAIETRPTAPGRAAAHRRGVRGVWGVTVP